MSKNKNGETLKIGLTLSGELADDMLRLKKEAGVQYSQFIRSALYFAMYGYHEDWMKIQRNFIKEMKKR